MCCLVGLSGESLIGDDHFTNQMEKKKNTYSNSHNGDIKENAWVTLGNMQKICSLN